MESSKVQIPEGWEQKTLSKICNIVKGNQLNKLDLQNTGLYPCLNGGISPSGYTEKWNRNANTIAISEGGNSCGYVNFVTTRFWCGGHCYSLLELKNNITNNFLYHALKGRQYLLMDLRVGSGLPNIQQKAIKGFKIILPKSITEQKKIAEILSSVDKAIEQTDKLIAKYQRIKTGLMQDLLTKGIDENGSIRSEETHEFKDSELGRIPKEWEVKEIKNSARLKSGGTPNRQRGDFWHGDIPWVRTAEVTYNHIDATLEKITTKGLNNSSATLFPQKTILMALYGQGKTRGRVAILDIEATTNQACVGFLDLNNISTYFLYFLLINEYNSLRELSNDGAQKNLSANLLNKYKIKIPKNKEEQLSIESILLSNDKKIKLEKDNLSKLQSIKTGLMQDLLSGKVKVNELIKKEIQ